MVQKKFQIKDEFKKKNDFKNFYKHFAIINLNPILKMLPFLKARHFYYRL